MGSLLGLLKDPAVAVWVVLVVVNLAACAEGQSALLDANAVECLVGMLRIGNEWGLGSTRENCEDGQGVARGGGEWKLARKEKARRILMTLREWEESWTQLNYVLSPNYVWYPYRNF
ncbi:U-box domain-containing protein 38-like [Forsythia ovata]|uniref:U-box domain-containing protein 38-like n=1 Tax=Forsythia ovata TaxID=205694 RepID=A0ABD1VM12_9LAMI